MGLIPARAGNTEHGEHGHRRIGAHPRSRGEHLSAPAGATSAKGSSPLARGTRVEHLLKFQKPRAHPRSRGEHQEHYKGQPRQMGSSPLARGTPDGDWARRVGIGLIPARAGNTSLTSHQPHAKRAHPRSRGEHLYSVISTYFIVGSSPLARGTHLLTWGFTPYISKIESLWSQSLTPEYTISSHY